MKVLVLTPSSLHKTVSPPFLLHKPLSAPQSSSSSSVPIFSPSKHHLHKSSFMATCVETSRPDTSQLSRDPNRPRPPLIDDHSYNNYVKFCPPGFSDHVSCVPFTKNNQSRTTQPWPVVVEDGGGVDEEKAAEEEDKVDPWIRMQEQARSDVEQEPILSSHYYSSILSQRSLERALANHLAIKLSNSSLSPTTLFDLFVGVLEESHEIVKSVKEDLRAVKERDPACISYVHCFLNFKGFLACQAHRIAHKLWTQGRKVLALLIQTRVSEVFAVDIHPGAKIGRGILLDHATGVVVGETAVIGNNVSILHNVTLGGTGKVCGDRHPKIGDGVLIGAGTCILGNIRIGDGAKIGAGSVVLKDVPPRTTAVGNPARLIGGKENPVKLDKIPSLTMDHTSHISEWCDYVI